MSAAPQPQRFIVLCRDPSGESFLKLDLLGELAGSILALKRIARKGPAKSTPDLFDTAELTLEKARQGTTYFVRDFRPLVRREGIGMRYQALHHASTLSLLLARNGPQMPDPGALFALAERSFDAFAAGQAPRVVLFKALFLLRLGRWIQRETDLTLPVNFPASGSL